MSRILRLQHTQLIALGHASWCHNRDCRMARSILVLPLSRHAMYHHRGLSDGHRPRGSSSVATPTQRHWWPVVRCIHFGDIRRKLCCPHGIADGQHRRLHQEVRLRIVDLLGVLPRFVRAPHSHSRRNPTDISRWIGNFVGPLLFKKEDEPVYAPGFLAVVVTSVAAALLALAYRFLSMWENKRRDKAGILEAYEHAYDDDLTDRKV